MNIRFADLPDDMQVLIGQFAEDFAPDHATGDKNWKALDKATFTVTRIPLDMFPVRSIGRDAADERGKHYAMDMRKQKLPPVLLYTSPQHGVHWLDGRHRIYMARKTGMKSFHAIFLSEHLILDMGPKGALGMLK